MGRGSQDRWKAGTHADGGGHACPPKRYVWSVFESVQVGHGCAGSGATLLNTVDSTGRCQLAVLGNRRCRWVSAWASRGLERQSEAGHRRGELRR